MARTSLAVFLLLLLLVCVLSVAVRAATGNVNQDNHPHAHPHPHPHQKREQEQEQGQPRAAVNIDELFGRHQKLKHKLAEFEQLHTTDAAAAADATTERGAKGADKHLRKVEEKRAQLATLEQQLKDLGVDIAAKEQEAAQAAQAIAQEKELDQQFKHAWINKLHAEGRAEEAERETQKLAGIKHRKSDSSASEKATHKIGRLHHKLEREQYRIKWLEERQQQQQQHA